MTTYSSEPVSRAEWSGAGYPADSGNPTLTHIHADGAWVCACDEGMADIIKEALSIRDRYVYLETVASL